MFLACKNTVEETESESCHYFAARGGERLYLVSSVRLVYREKTKVAKAALYGEQGGQLAAPFPIVLKLRVALTGN